jgi:large repetitive protein
MNRFIVKTLIVLVIVGIPLFGFSDTEEFLVNTYTSNAQQLQSIAMDDAGNFVITWTSDGQDGYGWGVYAKRFKSDGTPDGSEFQVNTTTNSNEGCPSVAMDSVGNFVIAWDTDGQDGSGYGVFTQRFDNSGNPVGSEFQVNTYTESVQRLANITMANNRNFVITWPSWGQDYPSTNGIFAQLYDKFGNPVGSEFQVNTFAEFNQTSPTAAFNSAGDFIIAWDSGDWNGNGDDYWAGVFAQRFDSSGNPIGSEFQVNTYTYEWQQDPSIAMDSEGNFVITWMSYDQDGWHMVFMRKGMISLGFQ